MGNFYMESTQINYRRDEKLKTVDQKLQELSETSAIDTDIAPVFKSTNTYAPGDMVYYRNKLYVFNVEHTGAWAAGDVTATDVTTQMGSLRSGLTNYEATTNAALAVPENTGKNVLPYTFTSIKQNNSSGTWVDNTVTINGVTYTITASGDTVTKISATRVSASESNAILELGDYAAKTGDILSGCPSGGSNTTYKVYCRGGNTGDFGEGATIAAGDVGVSRRYSIAVFSTSSPTNLDFYPMIRPATITDATFAPYIPSVESRIEAVESGLINVVKDVTSDFTLTAPYDVFFTVTDNPISKSITIFINGHNTNGFTNGSIKIAAPTKYKHNIANDTVIGASGCARDSSNTYAFVIASAKDSGVSWWVNYSQNITAVDVGFVFTYQYS